MLDERQMRFVNLHGAKTYRNMRSTKRDEKITIKKKDKNK